MGTLTRRIQRLEKRAGGDFQAKIRILATAMGLPAEKLLVAARGYEEQLNREIGLDGTITWEGFVRLRELGGLRN